jgi:hypothetical protein
MSPIVHRVVDTRFNGARQAAGAAVDRGWLAYSWCRMLARHSGGVEHHVGSMLARLEIDSGHRRTTC